MKYKVVETVNNPFGDYFEISNPSYHQTIQKHYVKTKELVLNSETSILLTEFRKDKDNKLKLCFIFVVMMIIFIIFISSSMQRKTLM